MDTRFEINIKQFGIKGDNNSLYLYYNGRLFIKLDYKDIKAAVGFLGNKILKHYLSQKDKSSLPNDVNNSDDEI